MDFTLNREQEMLRKAVRDFAEAKVAPRVPELDAKGEPPKDIVQQMGQMGFSGLLHAKTYGGSGLGHLARVILMEELSRIYPSLGFVYETGNLFPYILETFATEEQKQKLLPDLAKANRSSAFALTEATGGSDPSAMTTEAVLTADGDYIVDGRKRFITMAQEADVLGFAARSGKGFNILYVERGMPGWEVTRREPRPGLRCIPVNELAFTNCRVPKENLVGPEGKGLVGAITGISVIARTGAAAVALGAAQGAYEAALKFCKERILYGAPIANLQAIQFALAEMSTDIAAARWLCYYPAVLLDQGKSAREVGVDIARAKLITVDVAIRVATKAQQVMGAYGQSPEYRVELFLRDALELLSAGGTQEIMNVTIGRAITS